MLIWNLANEYPSTTLPAQADTHFAARVAALTDGALRIAPQFEAALGLTSREHLRAVAVARVPMASTFTPAMAADDPIFELSALPFLTADVTSAQRLFAIARPYYDRALARHNQRALYLSPWPPTGLWAKEPVATLEVLQRQCVRTFDAASAELLKRLGAVAHSMPFSEALPRVKSGEMSAVLSSGDGGAGPKLWQYLPHFTALNYAVPLSLACVNLDTWNALDATTQQAVLNAADETSSVQWERMLGRVETNYATMRANGVTITPPSPEFAQALRTAARGIITRWEAQVGADATAILREFGAI
jgi:TRAP-type transport system periplasmic protein